MPYSMHSAGWWRRHWERSGILDVAVADTLPDGWRFWRDWLQLIAPANEKEIRALEAAAAAASATSGPWAAAGPRRNCSIRS
jgi:hypothetical protein